jgi:hypothetical protein
MKQQAKCKIVFVLVHRKGITILNPRVSVQSSELVPLTRLEVLLLPTFGSRGGATLAYGGGGGGSQFRRLNRHSGTLYSKPSSLPIT